MRIDSKRVIARGVQVEQAYLTVRQLALYLAVSIQKVYNMLETRELPAVKIGSVWRFHVPTIDAHFKKRMVGLDPAPPSNDPLKAFWGIKD